MAGRNLMYGVFSLGGLILYLFNKGCGIGFLAGGGASFASFYILQQAVQTSLMKRKMAGMVFKLLLPLRVILAGLLLAASFLLGAHPVGIFAGVTWALTAYVYFNVKNSSVKICKEN